MAGSAAAPTLSWHCASERAPSAIGRPHVDGLAIAGAEGATEVLRNLRAELDLLLGLTGCTSLADLAPDRLVMAGGPHRPEADRP